MAKNGDGEFAFSICQIRHFAIGPPATYLTNDRLTVCNCFLELDATPLPLLPLMNLDPASTGDGGWHTSRFYQTMCPGQRMSQLKICEWVYIIGHNYHGLYCHGHKFSRT